MTTTQPKPLLRLMFFIRLLLFLAAPALLLYSGLSPSQTALIIGTATLMTWLFDYLSGRPVWLAAHRGTLLVMALYLATSGVCLFYLQRALISTLITILILLLALSSDAIANSRRWKVLLPAGILAGVITILPRNVDLYRVEALFYPAIPFLASMARLIFPRTKHLMHTSLDYPFARLEILSLGMKRVAAIGIRRKKLLLPHEQTDQIS